MNYSWLCKQNSSCRGRKWSQRCYNWSELESETYKESISDKKRKIYIYKKADSELLKGEISSAWDKFQTSQPHDRSVEQNWCHFTSIILTAIKNHVPTKTISGRWNLPWITRGLRLTRKKQRVYNLAKRTQNPQNCKKFKELRKTWKRSLLVAHNDYVRGLLD